METPPIKTIKQQITKTMIKSTLIDSELKTLEKFKLDLRKFKLYEMDNFRLNHLDNLIYEISIVQEAIEKQRADFYKKYDVNEFGDILVVGCVSCGEDVDSTDENGHCKDCR